nr:uncharacterized protein LOC111508939 [Leptinotarsa decemlineata]
MLEYLLLLSHLLAAESCGDYYWRDFSGRIPSDAIPAGNNANGLSYIGQAYLHLYGVGVGTIIPNTSEILVPCYGHVHAINTFIKILCSSIPSMFHWIHTSVSTFKMNVKDQCPVLGGLDRKTWDITGTKGKLNIGRIYRKGEVIVGPVASYDNDVWLYYPSNGIEARESHYEVLVYRGQPTVENDTVVKEVSYIT